MKTRLVSLTYRGSASVDPRYSAAMLPWTINDIRSTESYSKLSVGIENGVLESYNSDFELQFSHPLKHIVGMCRIVHKQSNTKSAGNGFLQLKAFTSSGSAGSNANGLKSNGTGGALTTSTSYGSLSSSAALREREREREREQAALAAANGVDGGANEPVNGGNANNFMEFLGPITGLVYLMKDPRDPLLHIYLFECEAVEEMAELMHQMRDPAHTLGGSVGSIPQTFVANGSSNDLSMQRALTGNGIHATPATNLKLSEAVRNAQHDASPNIISSKMKSSKSYTHGLSNSAGTVHIPTSTSAQSNLSLLADISPNHTHFFEVMYVGKIRVSHKRVPFSFIDDALPKFKAYDAQRTRLMQLTATATASAATTAAASNRKLSLNVESSNVNAHANSSTVTFDLKAISLKESDAEESAAEMVEGASAETEAETSTETETEAEQQDAMPRKSMKESIAEEGVTQIVGDEQNTSNKSNKLPKRLLRGISQTELPVKKDIPKQRDRSASYGCIPPFVEQNRTMVFLVGRSDLRLISPDRKQVLLYKDFKDVASCAQGQKNPDHFGIICREVHNDGYIGYVFKCQSDHVCDDIVAAISQAFVTCAEQKKKEATQIFSCEHCPMLWYHKLCSDVEGLSEKKTQAMIFRRIESLTDDEQDMIWAKYYGSEKTSSPLSEQNQFLMMLLRAHCESRQQRHVHDTAENRSEFLNQYLGGSTIFMKAKRSLTNSFDHLLKRKASKDDIGIAHDLRDHQIREKSAEPHPVSRSGNETPPEGFRSRSNTIGSASPSKPNAEHLKSPMMDIFIKVGNSPKESEAHKASWRHAILNSVVTPSKGMDGDAQNEFMSPMRITKRIRGKRSREELRDLWKTAIRQTILLNRMETENAMLQARQNENELKRIKLDYEEIVPCDKQLIERWEQIIERDSMKIANKKDPKVLAQAIKCGVPRSKRGDVWTFLADQHSMNTAPVDTKKFPNFNTPYHTLLKNLTEHQHAIFIDLGRTFPNHKFYKDPLGVGQLSLFNLLKAYSILDPELGYCQGLGFICGILLLHCDEADAFQLLKHLMFRRQMRTKYLPDMKKFQLQLYQLSRLVKDHLPELYIWLDQNDVSPTLYAAPWILTVFSSQFPLGFVARVFDLLFLESSEVIFKFAIALLTVHKDELLARDNFEEIMDYLKTVVPKMEAHTMEKIMKLVFTLDVSKQLTEYNVEYNVLQEEISTANHHLEMLNREKTRNMHLEQQLQFAQSSIAQLEKTRSSQQTQITSLQTQVQSLELTIQTLGHFVTQLAEQNVELELPGDVRRILQQLDDLERQRRRPHFTERKIGKSVSVNSHLGFPLKVLEELNEREEHGSPQKKKEKTPFFEHTYEQLRQQRYAQQQQNAQTSPTTQQPRKLLNSASNSLDDNQYQTQTQQQRPNRLLDSADIQTKPTELKLPDQSEQPFDSANIRSPLEVDSGVGTPLSPPSTSSNSSSSGLSTGSSSGGSLFSRMGYRNTPTALSPLSSRQTLYGAGSVPATTTPGGKVVPAVAIIAPAEQSQTGAEMHPLSMVGEVNVRFNGTTQLKSIRPVHHMRPMATVAAGVAAAAATALQEQPSKTASEISSSNEAINTDAANGRS
ncbi:TBC1 domain family member 4 isoform X2 [Bactrocera neohumeralis]|uniref:TBC1 domain family member 4 isoform X2 n=1 Tax=Bactrocera neohumeralis TaxID=98809 RepID=UPI0021662C6F|nr:TBC1 domain family member 4 isoform X2 [Bactrocera neohumeralis]